MWHEHNYDLTMVSRKGFVSQSYAIRWNAACLTIVINVMIQRRISLVRGWCHESDCDGSRRLSHVLVTMASVSQFVKISCPEPLGSE